MSLVPAFEIGIWNAWILSVILYAAPFVPLSINNEKVEKRGSEITERDKKVNSRKMNLLSKIKKISKK